MNTALKKILTQSAIKLLLPAFVSAGMLAKTQASNLVYTLLPGSTITPIATGISEPLSGSFTWIPQVPGGIVDSDDFNITSLSFSSQQFTLTLANTSQPDNITQIGPEGGTQINAYVNLAGSTQNPWFLGAYGNGSYTGPATAPSELVLPNEALYPGGGGLTDAYLSIDAVLVPEPKTTTIVIAGLGLLALRVGRQGKRLWHSGRQACKSRE